MNGRLLRMEVKDEHGEVVQSSLVFEPPAALLAEPSAFARGWLEQRRWVDTRVSVAIVSWVREGGMAVDEALGLAVLVFTGRAADAFSYLTLRADRFRAQVRAHNVADMKRRAMGALAA